MWRPFQILKMKFFFPFFFFNLNLILLVVFGCSTGSQAARSQQPADFGARFINGRFGEWSATPRSIKSVLKYFKLWKSFLSRMLRRQFDTEEAVPGRWLLPKLWPPLRKRTRVLWPAAPGSPLSVPDWLHLSGGLQRWLRPPLSLPSAAHHENAHYHAHYHYHHNHDHYHHHAWAAQNEVPSV